MLNVDRNISLQNNAIKATCLTLQNKAIQLRLEALKSNIGESYLFLLGLKSLQKSEIFLRRLTDILVSSIVLFCLSPLLITVMILIKVDDRGPLFFKQERVGLNGKKFNMLKFRSMTTNAEIIKKSIEQHNESSGNILFKMKNDPRITKIGKWMRHYSIDELPQLINVLKGDMALVGPRPALPMEVAKYNYHARLRLQVKPGITCFWQIGGRSDLSFNEQIELDLFYIEHQSLLTDWKILLLTPYVVIKAKGAY